MEIVKMCVVGTGLLVNGIIDLRKRKLPFAVVAVYGIFGFVFWLAGGFGFKESLLPLLPGIVCLVFARISRQRVGYGDGLMLLATGFYLNCSSMFMLCMTAITSAGIFALILCVFFHKGRNYEIPFIPFLFLGYMVVEWMA